ncbi:MAG: nucleotidyltransferase family protein [Planctomycetota bacterium]
MLHDIERHEVALKKRRHRVETHVARCYSIVPAAGRSRRMRRPKLLLPWKESTIIDHVLAAWTSSRVDAVIVVTRDDDVALVQACRRWPVQVVHPDREPDDMKASIQCGLRWIATRWDPRPTDRCFIAPADLPTLTSELVDELIQVEATAASIVLPVRDGKTGHPALFPWPMTEEIFQLAADQGVNHLVDSLPTNPVPVRDPLIRDIDTPYDYREAIERSTHDIED